MKRLNRKKLIEQFEELRQGFRDSVNFGSQEPAFQMSMKAYHEYTDGIVVELGGESVLDEAKGTPIRYTVKVLETGEKIIGMEKIDET